MKRYATVVVLLASAVSFLVGVIVAGGLPPGAKDLTRPGLGLAHL